MHSARQGGAILIMTAILIAVLIGITALVLDLGRVFVLRSELQNAVDAAALAAAGELDGQPQALERARQAARGLMEDRGIYLGDFTLAGDDDLSSDAFTFYSTIDSETAPSKIETLNAEDALFVEVTIDLTGPGEGIPFFFLPVLKLFGNDTLLEGGLAASALAGRQSVICAMPPFLMCLDDSIQSGEQILLRQHGGSGAFWVPGNFAFLSIDGQSGAGDLAEYLASAHSRSCVPAFISSSPGQMAQPTTRGLNTRFDSYTSKLDAEHYPPAPNIFGYWKDLILDSDDPDERIGDGYWDRETYWSIYHSTETQPEDYIDNINSEKGWSRWRLYQWELGLIDDGGSKLDSPRKGYMPEFDRTVAVSLLSVDDKEFVDRCIDDYDKDFCKGKKVSNTVDLCIYDYNENSCNGKPRPENFYCLDDDCGTMYGNIYDVYGDAPSAPYPPAETNRDRRVMYVASLNCDFLNLQGNIKDLEVTANIGHFVQLFMTAPVSLDDPKFDIFAEYIGPAENEGVEKVIIQLYE